jgi:signal transduction histidine kinase
LTFKEFRPERTVKDVVEIMEIQAKKKDIDLLVCIDETIQDQMFKSDENRVK